MEDIKRNKTPMARYVSTPVLRKGKLEYSQDLTAEQVVAARALIGSRQTKPVRTACPNVCALGP